MTINSLSSVNTAQQQAIKNASDRLQRVINNIVSGENQDDVAKISVATQLRSETNGLRQASENIAQAKSLTQVAEGGVSKIQDALTQLQSLAQQAKNPTLNDTNRAQLNEQFQKVAQQIDNLAKGTSFNGKQLLNGELSGDKALTLDSVLASKGAGDVKLSVADLSTDNIFSDGTPNVLTAENASQALVAINEALNQVGSARVGVAAFQQTLDFAAANVETAAANQDAARATLTDTDIAAASTEKSEDDVKRNAAIALQAQGNKLSPALLKLIG
jgi:flagellin